MPRKDQPSKQALRDYVRSYPPFEDKNTLPDKAIDNTLDSLLHDDNNTLDSLLVHPSPLHDTITSLTRIEEVPHRRNGQHFESQEQKTAIQALFLEEFSKKANVSDAAAAAGIARETAYRWLREDTAFSDGWSTAEQEANDVLRREAHRRAVDGVSEPIVSMGKLVKDDNGDPLTVQKYDTPLLMMLMRARMPEYKDSRSIEMNSRSQIDINTSHTLTLDTRSMSQEELAQLRSLAESVKQREQARIDKTGKDKVIDAGE